MKLISLNRSTIETAAIATMFGISNLETALGSVMSLLHSGQIGLGLMFEKLTSMPAELLGRTDIGSLRLGANADITIFDPDAEWPVDTESFVSRGKNSPLHGQTLKGKVVTTVVGGEVNTPYPSRPRQAEDNMRANELIEKAHLLKDPSGKRKAVQLDYKTWEELLEFLEDIEDTEELDRVRESRTEYIPWEQAKAELRAKGVDV